MLYSFVIALLLTPRTSCRAPPCRYKQARLKAIQANVRSAWDVGHLLFSDMEILCKHLIKMKWEVKALDKGMGVFIMSVHVPTNSENRYLIEDPFINVTFLAQCW